MILLILPANIENAPYIQLYIELFSRNCIDFEIAYWDRLQLNKKYDYKTHPFIHRVGNGLLQKLYFYKMFAKFVENEIKLNKYDFIVVFTIQNAFFLYKFLKKIYSNKYLIDIRDYSILLRFCRCDNLFRKSKMNVISSIGFLKWLPKNTTYYVYHNLPCSRFPQKVNHNFIEKIKILTIGQLRDTSTNLWLISQLQNRNDIILQFSGHGDAKELLEHYVKENDIFNTIFTGSYNKEDEGLILKDADFMNIFLPNNLLSNTLMSNRFYLALLYRKPMIVNHSSEHAKYVLKYKLGIVVDSYDNIYDKIYGYIKCFDEVEFDAHCSYILEKVVHENVLLEEKILNALVAR